MHRLQRLSPTKLAASTPLPDVLGLAKKFPGALFRRGQTSLISAEPNNGKSPLVRWMCVQWALQGLRVLYFSADSDEYTTWKSVASAVTRQEAAYVERASRDVSAALSRLGGRMAFVFDTDPTYEDIQAELVAHWELWGSYPDVVVIDNLMDVVGENEDEFARLREHTSAFKRIARITDSHVIQIHHVNESEQKSSGPLHPPPRGRITGKVSKKPELGLTIAYDDTEKLMMIAVVKNRDGGKDPSGKTYMTLLSDPDRMQFHNPQTRERLGVPA